MEVISPFVLRAIACGMEEMQSPQAWADRCRAAAAEIEKLRAENEHLATSNHAYLSGYQEAIAEIEKLREALRELIYETTHLSPQEDDGSHRCTITGETLRKARAALGEKE